MFREIENESHRMLRIRRPTWPRRWNLLGLSIFTICSILLLFEFSKKLASLCNTPPRLPPTIHLVLAATKYENLDWTKTLRIQNLTTIAYIADDQKAEYHPPENKGNEAMIYLTYLYEFYDKLPDISIFTHGADWSWHIDGVLKYSTAYAIEHLDLDEVKRRKYLNLRVSWDNACPNWINTSVTVFSPEYDTNLKGEERFMREAFLGNFPNDTLPPILSAPCCSQFAVTRDVIRSIPRDQYKLQMDWLLKTHLSSEISGRIWEHLWQWNFLKKAVDCPIEHKALCKTYHICFEDGEDWKKWKDDEMLKYKILRMRDAMLKNGIQEDHEQAINLAAKIEGFDDYLQPWRGRAIERGKSEKNRKLIAGDL